MPVFATDANLGGKVLSYAVVHSTAVSALALALHYGMVVYRNTSVPLLENYDKIQTLVILQPDGHFSLKVSSF